MAEDPAQEDLTDQAADQGQREAEDEQIGHVALGSNNVRQPAFGFCCSFIRMFATYFYLV